jgi:hypothetical protein
MRHGDMELNGFYLTSLFFLPKDAGRLGMHGENGRKNKGKEERIRIMGD